MQKGTASVRQRRRHREPGGDSDSPAEGSDAAAPGCTPCAVRYCSARGCQAARYASLLAGLVLMAVAARRCTAHLYAVHENKLFFSNILEVEREISFRTEAGLYYSYYKQLVNATSLSQGLYELTHDNLTEHLNTINILARFNIYQEVVLAVVYRSLPLIQNLFEPIYFYVDSIFALHSLLVCALYTISWLLTGTWLSGVLTAALYIVNRIDTTRVDWTIPLRESFALPFHWLQLAFITYYFRANISEHRQKWAVRGVAVSTFLFAICWQFNQFVLLLQAMALFAVQLLRLVPFHKIRAVYYVHATSMLLVCCAQFFNTMILSGLLLSFLPAVLIVMYLQEKYTKDDSRAVMRIGRILAYILLALLLTAVINHTVKTLLRQDADEHIFKFVLAKFGLFTASDFDVSMYVCNKAFEFMGWDFVERMNATLTLSFYAVAHAVLVALIVVALYQKWFARPNSDENGETLHVYSSRPELAFHAVNCLLLAVLAITTLRMKYLWSPYICILSSFAVTDYAVWRWIFPGKSSTKVDMIRHALAVAALAYVFLIVVPPLLKELEDLREFYDPDTVELMKWINENTAPVAAFSGSMQLLAAVKLCTLRPITNHPHYEDKGLRYRTRELYEMYSRTSATRVHAVMRSYNASYIIVEDSICLSPHKDGCRLTDIINTHLDGKAAAARPGATRQPAPPFCNEVRYQKGDYAKYFKLIFSNKTFRVYRVA